jgi:hypothetical protein
MRILTLQSNHNNKNNDNNKKPQVINMFNNLTEAKLIFVRNALLPRTCNPQVRSTPWIKNQG